ncbi:Uncharacterised protein [Mycobacteroides abscessus subsp. massiliense]|nr:Uncharacterised protein [Mycobacteroides abscessus subsp. massiliense]
MLRGEHDKSLDEPLDTRRRTQALIIVRQHLVGDCLKSPINGGVPKLFLGRKTLM